jgi:hypothetical protein
VQERFFKPEVVLGFRSAKAYVAAFGIFWYAGAGVCVGILNDPRFKQPGACVACDNIRPLQRHAVWVICFVGSGLCLFVLFWFYLETLFGPSAPPALEPVQGRLFTYGTRSTSYHSNSTQDGHNAAIYALSQAQALAAATAAKKKTRLGALLTGRSSASASDDGGTIRAVRDVVGETSALGVTQSGSGGSRAQA